MADNFDLLRSLGASYLIGPVYFGQASDQTGQLVLFNSSSVLATTLQAGNTTAAITYTLPTAGPAGNNYLLGSSTVGVLSWINAPGTYAPIGSAFVTIGTDATLTSERALTGTANQITVTDNGAGSTAVLSFPSTVDITAISHTGGTIITGTNTNDSAASGKIGEYIESVIASTNAGTSGLYTDFTSISLTAGDWDVSLNGTLDNNAATGTGARIGISTTTGNSSTGLVVGSNTADFGSANAALGTSSATVGSYRVSLSSTTTIYYKLFASYAGGPPKLAGRISARRVR